ncbi:hypothetical protein E9993_20190 [Labilibacter sediminis]|nr:hypothetical protein E9993_20190 [Labilibacter sediminis]
MLNLFKTLLETSKERLKSPLISSFLLAFIAINWRPLMILLYSKKDIEGKIDLIDKGYSNWLCYFGWPLGIALFYILLLPYLSWFFDWVVEKSTSERRKIKNNQTLEELQGKEEIVVAEYKLEQAKANYAESADLNKKIDGFKKDIENKDKEIKKLIEREGQVVENLSAREKQILDLEKQVKELINSLPEQDGRFELPKEYVEEIILDKEYLEFKQTELYNEFGDIGELLSGNKVNGSHISYQRLNFFAGKGLVKEVSLDRETKRTHFIFTKKGEYFWKKYQLEKN